MQPVRAGRQPRLLVAVAQQPVVIHHDSAVRLVDMGIRRGDMRIEIIAAQCIDPVRRRQRRVRRRVLRLKQAVRQRDDRVRMHRPRPLQPVGIGEAQALALVMPEIHVEGRLFPRRPVRHAQHRRPVDVGKGVRLQPGEGGGREHAGGDKRRVGEPGDSAGEGGDAGIDAHVLNPATGPAIRQAAIRQAVITGGRHRRAGLDSGHDRL